MEQSAPAPKPNLLLLSQDDNVFVALEPIAPGVARARDDKMVKVVSAVTLGHKVARCQIARGEKIIKYGVPIGSATAAIAPGEHVHVHNMKSDYTATHSLAETAKGTPHA